MTQKSDKFRIKLNNNKTPSEKIAWDILHNEILQNKISVITNKTFKTDDKHYYFIDLWIKDLMLGIELDGGIHKQQINKDLERDNRIMKRGLILMIRFENKNVLGKNQDYFKYVIKEAIKSRVIFLSSNIKGHKRLNKFLNKWYKNDISFTEKVSKFLLEF